MVNKTDFIRADMTFLLQRVKTINQEMNRLDSIKTKHCERIKNMRIELEGEQKSQAKSKKK